jgi:IS30 family transposase
MSEMGQVDCNTRKSAWKQLSERERYKIEALVRRKVSPTEIGKELGRDRRTIEREILRGTVQQLDCELRSTKVYFADAGQRIHNENASNKGRGLKIGSDHKLAAYLEKKIGEEKWSPDAAIGSIAQQGLSFEVSICTKTVYNMIERGDFLNLTNKSLPQKKHIKRRDYKPIRRVALKNIRGMSIEERPADIETRQEYGHWEMDCVVGNTKACLLVLTERKHREEIIIKLPAKTQACVVEAINALERRHKGKFATKFKSITMDNGSEFLDSQSIEASCIKPQEKRTVCYYAHPYCAWERGSNENQNRLIRRFIPKGSNINKLSKTDIKRVQNWINNYPRRILGYKSANEMALTA